jgi:peptide/nickel transport system substrate-binding protein
MKNLARLVLIGVAVALLAMLIVPVFAQDKPKPGEGGVFIEGNFGGDPASLNPILANDTASSRVTTFLFPALLGVDGNGLFVKDDKNFAALVKDWTISSDGKVYTFKLRDDWKWSDGTPMTTKDVLYTWNVIKGAADNNIDTQLVFLLDIIEKVEAPDATTLVVSFKDAACTALNNAGILYPVPSHVMPTDLKKFQDDPFNLKPTVTQGVFNFGDFRAGEQVSLIANQDYPGKIGDAVYPKGWVYKNVPDQTVLVEQFLAGETNVIDGPPVNRRSDVRAAADKKEVTIFDFPGNAWDYLALNYADPANPQNGVDKDGKRIDQGNHPLFGDVKVRQAIARALDVDAMIKAAVFGEGTRMNGTMVPASWAYAKDLAPIPLDVEAAKKMLDEAGFPVGPDGIRVAKGAKYAPDGTPFKFTLYTNEGNTRRGAIATLVQDQLKQIGIQVDFQAIDFNTLLKIMNSQTYDAFILGWRNGFPDDPDQTQLFGQSGDTVGSGSNNTSYYNPKVDELMQKALNLPGCDQKERAKIYGDIQKIFQEDLPYIPLFVINGMYAARANTEGFSPYPSLMYWNVDQWYLRTQ